MKTALFTFLFLASVTFGSSTASAQLPSMQDLSRNVDQAASTLEEKQNSFLGFKKLELPDSISNLVDIRFKRPKFAFLEKLKNFGKPNLTAETPTQGPILAGLSKLFQPKPSTTPSLLDRMLGKDETASGSILGENDMAELSNVTNGLQQHVDRMSREARTNAADLFSGLETSGSPQPPLRSAREYSGDATSRY